MMPLGVIKLRIDFFIFYKLVRIRIDRKNIFIRRPPDQPVRSERQIPYENRIGKFGNIQGKLRDFLLLLDIPHEDLGFLLGWRGTQSAPDGRRSENLSVHISGTEHTLILDHIAVDFGFSCRCIMDRKRSSQRTVTGDSRNKQFAVPFRHMDKPLLIISEYREPLRIRASRFLIQIINV
ncbi:hypothetical protein D3C73_814920 [compost metagenome]